MPKKILIFEYITSGGVSHENLPDSLVNEGKMMVEALLANFLKFADIEIVTMQTTANVEKEFQQQLETVDAVWVIAPEFDGILERFCNYAEQANKILLTSPAKAVALTANKLKTFQILKAANIQTVPTEMFDLTLNYNQTKEWIIKPIDGAGSENTFLLTAPNDWQKLPFLEKNYIIQPHLNGDKTSLSCLFKNGSAQLVCINLQIFEIQNQQYALKKIDVNYKNDDGRYQKIAEKIAHAFPDLFGYVGIDLIEDENQCFVLEINPRLTTSFVDIERKVGMNIAELVLNLANA